MRVTADHERCFGAGQCVMIRPDLFDQSDIDGTVIIRVDRIGAEHLADVRKAVTYCPSRALSLGAD